jgi:hypothetical protein
MFFALFLFKGKTLAFKGLSLHQYIFLEESVNIWYTYFGQIPFMEREQ